MDSFKGSLSSLQAGEAVREGILRAHPQAQTVVSPLADGGEGTVEALAAGPDAEIVETCVCGPLMRPVRAKYCILRSSGTAVIEMAAAAGITQLSVEERDPLMTTTYGVGELIRHAIGRGCRRFIVGIGGSATNDGGAGMLQSLGFELLDGEGRDIPPGAAGLAGLCSISDKKVLPELDGCSFRIACDVKNPLCGPMGCSAVFGPQKGATPETVRLMDGWLRHYARLVKGLRPHADDGSAGAGAAGGLGFAFLAFTNATLSSGVDIVLEETGLGQQVAEADIVVTGEGRLDGQTVMGKAPVGVARLAKRHGKRVIAFGGMLAEDAQVCNDHGIDALFSILPRPMDAEQAMDARVAYENLANTACQVFRLL